MTLFGITGTNGSGKSDVCSYLKETYGFGHISFREILLDELARNNVEPSRENLAKLGTKFRRERGSMYLIDLAMEISKDMGPNVILDSIRSTATAKYLKETYGAFLLGVDAPIGVRYDRVLIRADGIDCLTFQEFADVEEQESGELDSSRPNIFACLKLSDFIIYNNGTISNLESEIEKVLGELD